MNSDDVPVEISSFVRARLPTKVIILLSCPGGEMKPRRKMEAFSSETEKSSVQLENRFDFDRVGMVKAEWK